MKISAQLRFALWAAVMTLAPSGAAAQSAPPPAPANETSGPAGADHRGHAGHGQAASTQDAPAMTEGGAADDHAMHQMSPRVALPSFIPPVTDKDRAAAFPDVKGHAVHDNAVNSFVLLDQLEWQTGSGDASVSWDAKGWVGQDRDRLWARTEGAGEDGRVAEAEAHLMYGRAIARWWDLVAGVRQDVRPGPARTWAAVGIQGLAPYWFEVEATGYVGEGGRTHLRLETEYDLLLTNRLILQPLVEVQVYGKADPSRDLGTGLGSTDLELRLRYEIRREFAPYVGVSWNRKYFGTADLARAAGERTSGARLALGLRLWM